VLEETDGQLNNNESNGGDQNFEHEIAVSGVEEDWEDTIAVPPNYLDEIDNQNGSKEEESVNDINITSQDSIIWLDRHRHFHL
jgi:hypothetical protein